MALQVICHSAFHLFNPLHTAAAAAPSTAGVAGMWMAAANWGWHWCRQAALEFYCSCVPHWHWCREVLWKWANSAAVGWPLWLLRNSALHFYAGCVVPAKIIFKESGIILRDVWKEQLHSLWLCFFSCLVWLVSKYWSMFTNTSPLLSYRKLLQGKKILELVRLYFHSVLVTSTLLATM